jgi:hypothetical protein
MVSDETLAEIGQMAELQFSNDEIALIVGLPHVEMRIAMDDHSSPVYEKVMAGRLRNEAELRKVIIKLSKQGSSPAQALLLKMIKDRERKDWMKK